ncbi:hypothetical protein [Ralstonia solanacearum]|uniref:hypothetical protein n=1 Tax=Ralstonia solanacearum TaxID=305 RepID=UPI001E574084|nr:hypothetical protein [Ralstonia solanacearum]MDC6180528.1 hypothetical protein [Ralstonia solanacearum]MDC6213176.1 hypothetical protein [Ralstonia solanacearum]MDC6242104.1 hypothetical protein [Ralstonia solanacearum]MDD7803771.1 hypothetical protein [Ralstonia solanacearum]
MRNPDWQKEYARWYGKPPQGAKQGVHWTLSLMVWVAVLLVVYVAAKQLRLTGSGAALPNQQAASTQSTPTTALPQRQPVPPVQQPTARPAAPLAGVNKCVINEQTVYTEAPCAQAMRAPAAMLLPKRRAMLVSVRWRKLQQRRSAPKSSLRGNGTNAWHSAIET